MSQSPVVLRGGVPIIKLDDGRLGVVLTPAESVLCGDNELLPDVLANMKTAIDTAIKKNDTYIMPVSAILQASENAQLDAEIWHPCDGTVVNAEQYPELYPVLADTPQEVIMPTASKNSANSQSGVTVSSSSPDTRTFSVALTGSITTYGSSAVGQINILFGTPHTVNNLTAYANSASGATPISVVSARLYSKHVVPDNSVAQSMLQQVNLRNIPENPDKLTEILDIENVMCVNLILMRAAAGNININVDMALTNSNIVRAIPNILDADGMKYFIRVK